MSLLDHWNYEVTVYPEEVVTDQDGNVKTRPSSIGVPAKAGIQVAYDTGTSARRRELEDIGFQSEERYRIRFTRESAKTLGVLGAQSVVEWRGVRWQIFGEVSIFRYGLTGRTHHDTYFLRRS